jgi:hypothetical protein
MFKHNDLIWHNRSMRDKLGYYLVGNRKFYNKVAAILEFQKTHHFPKYVFNDDVFARYNKCGPIEANIFDLYKERAKQLRDKYDTIVLSFSGGSDSLTILNAFIEAKVPVDILLLIHADSLETSMPDNIKKTYKEIYGYAIPYIDNIDTTTLDSIGNPKVISYDMTKAISEGFFSRYGKGWSEEQNSLDPTVYYMTTPFLYDPTLKSLVMDNDKDSWCFIRGGEKPFVDISDATSYFIDEKYKDHTHWPNCELFFTTPDMPEIHIKQEQLLFDNIKDKSNANFDLTSLQNKDIRDSVPSKADFWPKELVKDMEILSLKSNSIKNYIMDTFPGNLDIWKDEVKRINDSLDKRWFDNKESINGGIVGIKSRGYRFNG